MLKESEIHKLAMKEVGDYLSKDGYDFLAVNSQLKKDPQFVCLKDQNFILLLLEVFCTPTIPKNLILK